MEVLDVLMPRYHQLQLKGFQKGYFDPSKTKFYAYTLLSVKDEDYEDLYNFFLYDKGYSQFEKQDEERYRIYNEDGSYIHKDVSQLVSENIFKYISLVFHGMLYEKEWYILDGCYYSDKADESKIIQEIERSWDFGKPWWENMTFQPILEYREELDYNKICNALSIKETEKFKHDNLKMIHTYLADLPLEERPWRREKQFATDRDFVGQLWIVGHIKQEQKSKLNNTFEIYINEAVFKPFVQILRNINPDIFYKTETLFGRDCYPLIYPHTKEHILCILNAEKASGEGRLFYFLYIAATMEIYEWLKPTPQSIFGHYAEVIQEDIRDFSEWGLDFALGEPSVTMDDPVFWEEHILKKEAGDYIYLKKVDYQNHKQDIYPLF